MSTIRIAVLLCLCGQLFGAYSDVIGQVDVEWIARYDGPGHANDSPTDMAVDDSGYIYVTGYSMGPGTSYDFLTIKYAPSGDTVWVSRYDSPWHGFDYSTALALDDSGYVYVTGISDSPDTISDYATIKYSSAGDTIWVRRYDGPGSSYDYPAALAVDASGNVCVTGQSGSQYATVKYSPAGDTLWVRRYSGPGPYNSPYAMAVDDNGYVYVTGKSLGSVFDDMATIKYAPEGDMVWVRRYNGPMNYDDGATALAVDDSGNVCVTGFAGSNGYLAYATIKYSSAGDVDWINLYEGPGTGTDLGRALAIDDQGNVYVTGISYGSPGTYFDYATLKYAPDGTTVWTRRYSGPGAGEDEAHAVAVDDDGNVYVTGSSAGGGEHSSNLDFATIKYSPDGDTLWIRRYNGPDSGSDAARAIALDHRGNAYVTGGSWGDSTNYDFVTLKYTYPSGDVNCDDHIDLADVILLGNYLDGLVDFTDICGGRQADVDLDGDIDEDDYNLLYDAVARAGP